MSPRHERMPEDEDIVDRLDRQVSDILELLEGDKNKRRKGVFARFDEMEARMDVMEKGYRRIYTLLIGIAIGIGIGGVLFGVWGLKEFIGVLK
jgi:hypothetical protein